MCSLTCIAGSDYQAPWWQPSGHLQTVWPYLFPPTAAPDYQRERWELPDGDFLDVDWTAAPQAHPSAPTLIVFHGLEGNAQSHYARTLMQAAIARGWHGVVVHFRGCSGEPNRLPRVYYAGDAKEISYIIQHVRQQRPDSPLYAAGISLGGNALLKWLGEYPQQARQLLQAAATISAPIPLKETADALQIGLNDLLYNRNFVATMKRKALAMAERFPTVLDKQRIADARTVRDMDNAVTAVLYGARDADDYYAQNSARPWLNAIRVPTLILNALNDPFVPAQALPTNAEVSSTVTLVYPDEGGHAGFYGWNAARNRPWLGEYILDYLQQATQAKATTALTD